MSVVDLPIPTVRPIGSSGSSGLPGPGGAGAYAPPGVGHLRGERSFPAAARGALADTQLRRNLGKATSAIRAKRASVVDEVSDWEELRAAGSAVKADVMARLPELLVQLEESVTARGGTVHWARDAAEANEVIAALVLAATPPGAAPEVVKVKSMATAETGLNEHLQTRGVEVTETDLAELIVQLAGDAPSHILVPAIHRNRAEVRQTFLDRMEGVDPDLTDDPTRLAMAARSHLRAKFLSAGVAISGANFAVADTGTLAVVESEGNGRMCLTVPRTLITLMGVEKVVPTWGDLEVFLQLLPRSSTGERMNPYTSTWTGVTPHDGPQDFHLVLMDNGRSAVLADQDGRAALHCIRCSACLNVCPVYERAGGHAYGSIYPGPIGAVLSPMMTGITGPEDPNASLPYASTLCGACFDACPVKIDIPNLLVQQRAASVASHARPTAQDVAMAAAAQAMAGPRRFAAAEAALAPLRALGRRGRISALPWPASLWTSSRDVPAPPAQTFRRWWAGEHRAQGATGSQEQHGAPR